MVPTPSFASGLGLSRTPIRQPHAKNCQTFKHFGSRTCRRLALAAHVLSPTLLPLPLPPISSDNSPPGGDTGRRERVAHAVLRGGFVGRSSCQSVSGVSPYPTCFAVLRLYCGDGNSFRLFSSSWSQSSSSRKWYHSGRTRPRRTPVWVR